MTNHRPHLPLLLLALALSACSRPAYDNVSAGAPNSPEKVSEQIADLAAAADQPTAKTNATQSAHPSAPPPSPTPTPAPKGFPVTAAPSLNPITDHSPGIPSTLGTLPPTTAPAVSAVPTTTPATQPIATTPPATAPAPIASTTPATTEPHIAASTPPPQVIVHGPSTIPLATEEPTFDQAMAALQKHIAAHPTLNTTLALDLLDVADGKTPDPTAAASLSPTDQKLLTDILTALQGMTTAAATNSSQLSERAAPLVTAVKSWQADADLSLPKLALASRVDSFGIYTPVPATFAQGVPHTVLIYCEVANFISQKGDDGWYTTRLSQEETLLTEDGILAWRPNADEVEDRSMNQRHDFYLVKKLTLPDTLAAGKYTLRMKVVDHNSNKIAMAILPLEITAK